MTCRCNDLVIAEVAPTTLTITEAVPTAITVLDSVHLPIIIIEDIITEYTEDTYENIAILTLPPPSCCCGDPLIQFILYYDGVGYNNGIYFNGDN